MRKQIRIGKMHYKTVQNKEGLFPPYVRHPWLNLSGQWLEKAGFPVDAPIVIAVSNRKLVITISHIPECVESEVLEEECF